MNLHLRLNITEICQVVIREQLDKSCLDYSFTDSRSIRLGGTISPSELSDLQLALGKYGIEIVRNQKVVLVENIKRMVLRMLDDQELPQTKISVFLAQELKESYRNLAQVFTEVCHMTIENYIIIHKIERAKHLLMSEDSSLTAIAFHLNYSSVGHLSNQFKKVTGLTPTAFHTLAKKRSFSYPHIKNKPS